MATMTDSEKRTFKDQFMLRLPDGLRERIKAKAEKNSRSMNAEIVQLLEVTYPAPQDVMHVHIDNIRKALDLYEVETDPKRRMYLQHMVETMATIGHDMWFEEDEDFS